MNIKELNEALDKVLNESSKYDKVIDAINDKLSKQGIDFGSAEVDEYAYEPDTTIFLRLFDTFTKEQYELIDKEFTVFTTTEQIDGAEVYTESEIDETDESYEGHIGFVAIIENGKELSDEFVNELSEAFVKQVADFNKAIYTKNESFKTAETKTDAEEKLPKYRVQVLDENGNCIGEKYDFSTDGFFKATSVKRMWLESKKDNFKYSDIKPNYKIVLSVLNKKTNQYEVKEEL